MTKEQIIKVISDRLRDDGNYRAVCVSEGAFSVNLDVDERIVQKPQKETLI